MLSDISGYVSGSGFLIISLTLNALHHFTSSPTASRIICHASRLLNPSINRRRVPFFDFTCPALPSSTELPASISLTFGEHYISPITAAGPYPLSYEGKKVFLKFAISLGTGYSSMAVEHSVILHHP
jgi:hypothetical protein